MVNPKPIMAHSPRNYQTIHSICFSKTKNRPINRSPLFTKILTALVKLRKGTFNLKYQLLWKSYNKYWISSFNFCFHPRRSVGRSIYKWVGELYTKDSRMDIMIHYNFCFIAQKSCPSHKFG